MLIVFLDVKFSISGSSYTTVPDRIPTLGCQMHLYQFQPVGSQLGLVYVVGRKNWGLIHAVRGLRGTAYKCPQVSIMRLTNIQPPT